jgi:hypothetical protein
MEKSVHRHTWITRITRILEYRESAGPSNSNESFCPVATAPPRQYDPDYARAIYARRRPEEWIGGRPRVIFLRTLVQSNETNRADCHVMVRRRYVNAAALNALPFLPCSAGSGPAPERTAGNRLACVGLMWSTMNSVDCRLGGKGRDNSSYGLDASPRRSNDYNVSRGSGQASRRAFSIARLDADHPVLPRLSRHPPDVSRHSGRYSRGSGRPGVLRRRPSAGYTSQGLCPRRV